MHPLHADNFDLGVAANLNKWRSFVAIAQLGSLSRAAIFLDVNATLLSRQLNGLEAQCGVRLFVRTGRGLELSESGRRVLPHVKALLADAKQLEYEIQGQSQELTGSVSLATMPSLSPVIIERVVPQLRKHHPKVQLRLLESTSGKTEEWVLDGRADIGVLYRYGTSVPYGEVELARAHCYLVGALGNRVTRKDPVPFKALHELPLILPPIPNGLRHYLEPLARKARITLRPAVEMDSLPLMRLAVQRAKLFTILPYRSVAEDLASGQLAASRISDPEIAALITLISSRSKGPSRAVTLVTRMVQDVVTSMRDAGE